MGGLSHEQMQRAQIVIIAVGLIVITLGGSLLLAAAGEPSSVWIWRDVLGVTR